MSLSAAARRFACLAIGSMMLSALCSAHAWAADKFLEGCGAPEDGLRRIALVVGNANYPKKPLPLTINDSTEIAQALCDNGFAYVRLLTDATKQDIANALADLRFQATPETKVSVFYFSGHGMEIEGENYVIPVDADLSPGNESGISSSSIPVRTLVIPDLGSPGPGLDRIVILDACRANPLSQSGLGGGGSDPSDNQNLLIAFAGQSGKTVQATLDKKSLFTSILLRFIKDSDLSIENVHRAALSGVYRYSLKVPPLQTPDRLGALPLDYRYSSKPPTGPKQIESLVQQVVDRIWQEATPEPGASKGVEPSTQPDISSLSVSMLLEQAQAALNKRLIDADGKPAVDALGNPQWAPDFRLAASLWEAAWARGHSVSALRRLGDLYEAGRGVELDPVKAVELFKQAAALNDAIAFDRLGDAYRNGTGGLKQDYEAANRYYAMARDGGASQAIMDLGYMVYKGYGYDKPDPRRAVELFEEAAEAGVPQAHSWLAWVYLHDFPDAERARSELEISSDIGDTSGLEYLFRLYRVGYYGLVPRDEARADALFARLLTLPDRWFIKNKQLDKD